MRSGGVTLNAVTEGGGDATWGGVMRGVGVTLNAVTEGGGGAT